MTRPWKVVGAAVRGASHEQTGTPCQDAIGWLTEPGLTCLAVADGAGSRPRAEQGARAAVDFVLGRARAELAGPADVDLEAWLRATFAATRDELGRIATAEGNPAEDYATTLAVALVHGDRLAVAQVGDGIAIIGEGDSFVALSPPPRYEYANETVFLTSPDLPGLVRVDSRPAAGVTDLVLSTDGLRFQILADLARYEPYQPFFADVAEHARKSGVDDAAVHGFLVALPDQSGDDKSLVIAVRVGTGPHEGNIDDA